ncbi:hypothetical protein MKX08_009151 [Trichoderma sp. CBMAI-0020]|nr:hypothetical protein MKX08_009151 [Trichoderma sp. CBMAI-0020]
MASENRESNSELESFRQKWISDLRSRRESIGSASHQAEASSVASTAAPAATSQQRRPSGPFSGPGVGKRNLPVIDDDEYYLHAQSFDGPPPTSATGHLLSDAPGKGAEKPLISALDHYEEAMEKEAQGNMGESLRLYRKAYRLDNRIDQTYREKHFPGGFAATKAPTTGPAASSARKLAESDQGEPKPLTLEELIASFSTLKIEPAPPEIENTAPPPCPIANLPDELLVHILQDVAVADVGDFARLSLVCKHFAFLVATEQRPWKRVCLGSEFGFTSVPRHWKKSIEWEDLEIQEEADEDGLLISMRELEERRLADAVSFTLSLHDPDVYPSWKHMFRNRPRIRFNGCYISTVNYVRSGQASTNQSTWGGAPVLIVTYYRYLRFFRDGTVISLLTTASPVDVVHHLTPELLLLHREAPHSHLPSAVMHQAYKGRWRQSSALDHPDNTDPKDQESDIYVETEGVGTKYMYRMDLTLRSAGKGTKNNKIVWRGFHSYNKLTDDWAEFQLKNDKPFFFSRVKSYGIGEPAKEL